MGQRKVAEQAPQRFRYVTVRFPSFSFQEPGAVSWSHIWLSSSGARNIRMRIHSIALSAQKRHAAELAEDKAREEPKKE